jgi:protein SCO1/2
MLFVPLSLSAATEKSFSFFLAGNEKLPPFLLFDDDFKPLKNEQLSNNWTLMFFGYTSCPDVCPTTLYTLAKAVEKIKQEKLTPPRVVFVSVDPWRDTPQRLKPYVQYFNEDFIGASADTPQLNILTNFFKIIYYNNRQQSDQAEYDVAHSDQLVVINPQVEFSGYFKAPLESEALAEKIISLIRNNP